jgi:propionyl-CoA carboxylase alpha chain
VALPGGGTTEVATAWQPGATLFEGLVDGAPVCVQVDRAGAGWRLFHAGCMADVLVLGPRAAELNRLMPAKRIADTSRFLLSPMPGLLKSVAVRQGQEIKAGEALCTVEAMKMENVLRAERDGTVARIFAAAGDSLAVDQKIVEFG